MHFTGSTGTFQHIWRTVGANVASYRNYPRIVGETGGKDFILAHPSADLDALAVGCVRGAYEYQGRSARPRRGCTRRAACGRQLKRSARRAHRDVVVGDPTGPRPTSAR